MFGLAIGGVAILLLAGSVTAYLFVSHQARHPGQVADPNTDEGRAQLIEDLSSTDFGIRHQALDQLAQVAKLPPDRAPVARTLERLVHDQNPFICESAIKALTIWGDQDSVLVLIGVLNADNPFVREKAMEALAKMKDPRAVKPLVALLREMSTRHGACEALKAFGPIAEKDVAARLQSTESFERQAACEISQEIGTERSIPALEAIVNDSDRHANFFAVSAARDALAAIRARSRKR